MPSMLSTIPEVLKDQISLIDSEVDNAKSSVDEEYAYNKILCGIRETTERDILIFKDRLLDLK
jgi:hypothetical protein